MFKFLKTNAQLREELAMAEKRIARQEQQIRSMKNEIEYHEGTYIDLREKLAVKTADVEWLRNDINARHQSFQISEKKLREQLGDALKRNTTTNMTIISLREKIQELERVNDMLQGDLAKAEPRITQGAHGQNINGQTLTGSMDMFVNVPKRAAVDDATRAAMISSPAPVSDAIIAASMIHAFSDPESAPVSAPEPSSSNYDSSSCSSGYDSSSSSSCDTGGGSW